MLRKPCYYNDIVTIEIYSVVISKFTVEIKSGWYEWSMNEYESNTKHVKSGISIITHLNMKCG